MASRQDIDKLKATAKRLALADTGYGHLSPADQMSVDECVVKAIDDTWRFLERGSYEYSLLAALLQNCIRLQQQWRDAQAGGIPPAPVDTPPPEQPPPPTQPAPTGQTTPVAVAPGSGSTGDPGAAIPPRAPGG